jgi:hypothetical protein
MSGGRVTRPAPLIAGPGRRAPNWTVEDEEREERAKARMRRATEQAKTKAIDERLTRLGVKPTRETKRRPYELELQQARLFPRL